MIFDGDNYVTIVPRAEAGISLDLLQQINGLQTDICKACNTYCVSIKKDVGVFASYLGSVEEKEEIAKIITVDMVRELCLQFNDNVLEKVIHFDTGMDYVKMTGCAICSNDRQLLGVYIMIAFVDDGEDYDLPKCIKKVPLDKFDAIALLNANLSDRFFSDKFYEAKLEEDLSHVEAIGHKLEHQLSKNEIITNILKLLESDNDFAQISEDIFAEAGRYLNVDDCLLIKKNTDDKTITCIAEWTNDDKTKLGDRFEAYAIEDMPFFNGRSYTPSSDSIMPDNFREFFDALGIDAGVFLPLDVNDTDELYCIFISEEYRKWTVEELKFFQDVRRVLQTILIKRITKNSLASSYTALEAILENAGCGICVDDVKKKTNLYANETYKSLLDDESDRKSLEMVIEDEDFASNNLHTYYAKNSDKWFDITFATTHWVDGREARLATVYDVTDVKRYQREIEKQARTDYLTGLYNRKQCEEDLLVEIRKANVTGDMGALLYLDLDDFKNINDGLGHQVGDQLLIEIAHRLDDVTGKVNKTYRVAGDEFIVLIPSGGYKELDEVCNNIGRLFARSWKISDKKYYCTMSMGYVVFPTHGSDVQSIIQRADIALSCAKARGKNRIEAYSEEEASNSVKRLDLEKQLRDAVADGCKEFEVYYQPVVNITGDDAVCCGAEALVRWRSKEFGFMNPADFIPLSEYLGLIVPIGEHVLIEACKRCKYWNDFGHPEYKVNVNLSVVQLLQKDIVDTVENALIVSGITPENLTLEVTEGLAINDMEAMKKILNGIKELGVRVALDDFGTGYSSLNHIKSMPLDVIKIDRCFVNGVGTDAFSDAFVKTVSKLADAIDVNVCVEGVEEERQREALDDMNIQMIQGFLYDRPLTQDEFERKYLV